MASIVNHDPRKTYGESLTQNALPGERCVIVRRYTVIMNYA